MAQVAQALRGLTEYLFSENQRLDQKDKETRVQLAAEHIANKFSELPPDADPRDMQALQFELIEDAAALGGLQENLPLISGLYSTAMQTRELERQQAQDTALGNIISKEFGVDSEGLSGSQKLQLAQLFKQYETEYQTVDESGYGWLKRFDMHGKEIFNLKINALGTEESWGLFKREALFKHGLDKDLAKYKTELEMSLKFGGPETVAPELAGKKFLKGQQGTNGELLYEDSKGGGGIWTINKSGKVVQYDGEVITRKGAGGSTMDLLQTIEQTGEVFGPEKLRIMNQIISSDNAANLVKALVPEFDASKITVTDANKNKVVNPALLESISAKFSTMTNEELKSTFQTIYEQTELTGDSPQMLALDKLVQMDRIEAGLKKQLFDSLPSTDRDDIKDVETWNKGVKGVRTILTDPNIPEDNRYEVQRYIAESLGLPDGSTVTMNDYQKLTPAQKEDLNGMIARSTTETLWRYTTPPQQVFAPFNPGYNPYIK